ncbi:hypothetical protein AOLI_G00177820 [Acnodon oligacanthus]
MDSNGSAHSPEFSTDHSSAPRPISVRAQQPLGQSACVYLYVRECVCERQRDKGTVVCPLTATLTVSGLDGLPPGLQILMKTQQTHQWRELCPAEEEQVIVLLIRMSCGGSEFQEKMFSNSLEIRHASQGLICSAIKRRQRWTIGLKSRTLNAVCQCIVPCELCFIGEAGRVITLQGGESRSSSVSLKLQPREKRGTRPGKRASPRPQPAEPAEPTADFSLRHRGQLRTFSCCVRETGVISASCMRADLPRPAHIAAGQVTLAHCCTARIKGSVRGLRRRGRCLRTPSWRGLLGRSEKRRS